MKLRFAFSFDLGIDLAILGISNSKSLKIGKGDKNDKDGIGVQTFSEGREPKKGIQINEISRSSQQIHRQQKIKITRKTTKLSFFNTKALMLAEQKKQIVNSMCSFFKVTTAFPRMLILPLLEEYSTFTIIARNLRRAEKVAQRLYPNHAWTQLEERIFLSPRKAASANTGFAAELRDAQILRDLGHTIHFVPDVRSAAGRKFDALVSGFRVEFKNVGGNANTLEGQFLKSRTQAPNVFINLETSRLTQKQAVDALHRARNSVTHTAQNGRIKKGWDDTNKFAGGTVILKINGLDHLVFLDVNRLKIKNPDAKRPGMV